MKTIIYCILLALVVFGGLSLGETIRKWRNHKSFEQHRQELLDMAHQDITPEDIRHIPSTELYSFYAALKKGHDRDRRWWQW